MSYTVGSSHIRDTFLFGYGNQNIAQLPIFSTFCKRDYTVLESPFTRNFLGISYPQSLPHFPLECPASGCIEKLNLSQVPLCLYIRGVKLSLVSGRRIHNIISSGVDMVTSSGVSMAKHKEGNEK